MKTFIPCSVWWRWHWVLAGSMLMLGPTVNLSLASDAESEEEIRVVIAGVDSRAIEAINRELTEHFRGKLTDDYIKLGWRSTIRLLNIDRDKGSGDINELTFSRGDFFVAYSPKEGTAFAQYKVELEIRGRVAHVVKAGVISRGAEPFDVE